MKEMNVRSLALDVFANRIHKYIGSYAVTYVWSRCDYLSLLVLVKIVIIFVQMYLKGLEFMGVYWDPALNKVSGEEAFINYPAFTS